MSNFSLSSDFSKPGSIVTIQGDCVGSGSTFSSSNEGIATLSSGNILNVSGIGETNISETTFPFPLCGNTGSILLTSTEDGKPFFMSLSDYNKYTNYELVFTLSMIFVCFLVKFVKNT